MIRNIAVIGAGQMGSGIAHVCALSGINAQVIDTSEAQCTKAAVAISNSLDRQIKKGTITEDQKTKTLDLLTFSHNLQTPETLDLIIEAVSENPDLKKKVLSTLSHQVGESTILATNTSSISISELGAVIKHPQNMIGMHFMNPVPIMPLIEIIPGIATSPHVVETILTLTRKLGKTPITSKDMPGFVVNRILMPMINEGVYALQDTLATAEDIDTAMKLGTNQPMGPLELADFIGLDTCLSIMQVLHTGLGDSKYRPCPLLTNYVNAGWLGKKTGRGFYKYEKEK